MEPVLKRLSYLTSSSHLINNLFIEGRPRGDSCPPPLRVQDPISSTNPYSSTSLHPPSPLFSDPTDPQVTLHMQKLHCLTFAQEKGGAWLIEVKKESKGEFRWSWTMEWKGTCALDTQLCSSISKLWCCCQQAQLPCPSPYCSLSQESKLSLLCI